MVGWRGVNVNEALLMVSHIQQGPAGPIRIPERT
jgi:hypothetical protein